jgi:hypothetical protein
MRAPPAHRQALLIAVGALTLGGLAAPAPAPAADAPQTAGSLPIERVIAAVRCNLDEALAATAKAHMRLTVSAVDLHLSAIQSGSGKAPAAVEVPVIAAGSDLRVLEAAGTASALAASTHAVDIRFVPFAGSTSGAACPVDTGLLSVVQSAIAALSADQAGTDRLVVRLAADFLISRGQDDKIGLVFLDRGRDIRNLAPHSLRIEFQLDRS